MNPRYHPLTNPGMALTSAVPNVDVIITGGEIKEVRVLALLQRRTDDGKRAYRDACRCPSWEYPLVELVWQTPIAT